MNSTGHQCCVNINYVRPQGIQIAANCTPQIVAIVFHNYVNFVLKSIKRDFRSKYNTNIIQVVALNCMNTANFIGQPI